MDEAESMRKRKIRKIRKREAVALVPHDYLQTTKQGEIEIKKRMRSLATGEECGYKSKRSINTGTRRSRNKTFDHMQRRYSNGDCTLTTQRIIHTAMKKDIEQF